MKLFYRQFGKGKPLIILHGLFGMSDNWMTLAKQLGESGFAVYALDLRNHGQSPHSDQFGYELMTQDVVELMDDLVKSNTSGSWQQQDAVLPPATATATATFSILGHSMGAKVAMLLALKHPERVEKLIAVDMAPRYYPPHHQNIFNAILQLGDLADYKSRKEVEQKLSAYIKSESVLQFLLKNVYWKDDKLTWRFNIPVLEKNIEDKEITLNSSSPFTKPVLFIKGEKSTYITTDDEREIKKLFPLVIFKTIVGAGHWVHADKPKEFFETVMAFLTS